MRGEKAGAVAVGRMPAGMRRGDYKESAKLIRIFSMDRTPGFLLSVSLEEKNNFIL